MSKWNLSIVAAALVTLASHVVVMAQIRQPMPVPDQERLPMPLTAPEPSQASQQPVKRQMPQSGAEEPGTNNEVQVNSTKIYSRKGQPHLALTAEGLVQYRYLGDQLTSELIQQGDVTGIYSYDRGGRFERIDYSDELVITATYGEHNELVRLSSSAGRSIDFGYHADVHPIRSVTPTEDFNRFHSAVALLRLKTPPSWWPEQPAMEHLMDNENKGGKESSSGNGWEEENEYPYDPFPYKEKTPDGVSSIPVGGQRLPENPRQPAPFGPQRYHDPVGAKPRVGAAAAIPCLRLQRSYATLSTWLVGK